MHGNVYELSLDWHTFSLGSDAVADPIGPSSGLHRVLRSGCWGVNASYCRSAYRSDYNPNFGNSYVGFRICAMTTIQLLAVEDVTVVATFDFRDYILTVASDHGTPFPSAGMYSGYCWHSTVTCSVDTVVGNVAVDYHCTGWSGTGSMPVSGVINTTGPILLKNVDSSIVWNWSTNWWLDVIAECLDNHDLHWTTGGDSNWFGEIDETFDGLDARPLGIFSVGAQPKS